MCLGVAGQVIDLQEQQGVVDIRGNRITVGMELVPGVKVDDYVLVHAGFAITILSPQDFQQHQVIMEEIIDDIQGAL